jgi:hypothetical protein
MARRASDEREFRNSLNLRYADNTMQDAPFEQLV